MTEDTDPNHSFEILTEDQEENNLLKRQLLTLKNAYIEEKAKNTTLEQEIENLSKSAPEDYKILQLKYNAIKQENAVLSEKLSHFKYLER